MGKKINWLKDMPNRKEGESYIYRHADKGVWEVKEQELLEAGLPREQVGLVMTILQENFPDFKEIPLKLEGIRRALKMADDLYQELPERSVLVTMDSGKDRAKMTNALVAGRIGQLETAQKEKRVDIINIDAKEITNKLADASDKTWQPYGEMIKTEGISESEAIARWLEDMNKPEANIPFEISPAEASRRYREVITSVRERLSSAQAPVVLLGAGHSGSLAQVRYEDLPGPYREENMPQFCEIYKFNKNGRLLETKRTEI